VRLARLAAGRAHVLLVEVPGFWAVRIATEQSVAARGWRPALSASDADALVVCGTAGAELSGVIETTWDQLPGPRVRVDLETIDEVPAALVAIESALRTVRREPSTARTTAAPTEPDLHHGAMHHGGMDHGGMDHEAMNHTAMGHGGMDHEAMDHGGMDHGGMGHGGMDMAPAGIPLAEGDQDRDGLEMDVLRVPLGPVLPYWPAGLVLRCVLHGDVIAEAEPAVLPAAHPPGGAQPGGAEAISPALRAARCCDAAADVLALAGSWSAAAAARRIAAGLVVAGDVAAANAALGRLHRHVSRSLLLRWSLRGLGPMTVEHLADQGLPDHLQGDVHDRLVATLTRARAALKGQPTDPDNAGSTLDALSHLVTGLDVAAARLVVASFGLQTVSIQGTAHG
jgi:hypothetical protein